MQADVHLQEPDRRQPVATRGIQSAQSHKNLMQVEPVHHEASLSRSNRTSCLARGVSVMLACRIRMNVDHHLETLGLPGLLRAET